MNQALFKLLTAITVCLTLMAQQPAFAIDQDDVRAVLNALNSQLSESEENLRIEKVEFSTNGEGVTIFADDRTHQEDSHWVPYDPNRWGDRSIFWAIDTVDRTEDVSWSDATAAIGRAVNTWDSVSCIDIPLVKTEDYGMDLGYTQWLLNMGGSPGWLADITHAGWLDKAFFDTIGGPGGGDTILGITITFIWTDEDGNPVDTDNNNKSDVAFREIYYNKAFGWAIDSRFYDIETIAAHEIGHALSLGHFGKVFMTSNGKLHFASRAVMTALYYDVFQDLTGIDNSSFCSTWEGWPGN